MNLLELVKTFLSNLQAAKTVSTLPTQVLPAPTPSASSAPTDKKESKDIEAAHSYLQVRWPKIKEKFETTYPGYTLKLAFVWRSTSFQNELYQIGRRDVLGEKVVTNCDGVKNLSKHNYWPAKAIDVNIYKEGKVLWADSEYAKLTSIVQELGLVHGLTWAKFVDPQHIEVPRNIV